MIPGDTSVINTSREEEFADHRVGMCPHDYDVVATDSAIVRWCTNCGRADIMQKNIPGERFPMQWQRIEEHYHV